MCHPDLAVQQRQYIDLRINSHGRRLTNHELQGLCPGRHHPPGEPPTETESQWRPRDAPAQSWLAKQHTTCGLPSYAHLLKERLWTQMKLGPSTQRVGGHLSFAALFPET